MILRYGARYLPRQRVIRLLPFVRGLISLLLVLVAGGCTTLNRPDVRLSSAKTIGIVSAMGDDFTLTRAGLTAPSEAERHLSVGPWGLDDLVAIRTGVLLGRRFQVEGLTYSRASFVAKEQPSAFAVSKLLRARENRVGDLFRTQVAPQGLDVYVVVTNATSSYGSRSRTVSGIGIIDRVAVFGSTGQLYALYTITVIDGHTFKVIVKETAAPLESDELFRLRGPSREIGADLLSAAQNPAGSDELKAAVVDLIDRGLAKTLQELQLIDQPKP